MPYETGGVLLRGKLIEIPNRALEMDLYNITIDDLREVVGDAMPDEVLFWHTHPGGMIGPSSMDLDARLEGFQYMVVSLDIDGSHLATRYGGTSAEQEEQRVRGRRTHTGRSSAEGSGRHELGREAASDLPDRAGAGPRS
jgi:proteasome lid subunit RPN8/RPN11